MSVSHHKPAAGKFRLTYEDLCEYPEDGKRHEIIDGVHERNPSPVPYHQALSRHIPFQLYSAIELTGFGQVIDAPIDVQFTDHDVVVPDIIVVLKGNEIITDSRIKGAPDLVIEILSPPTSKRDEGVKKALYETHGVPEYWVVDPKKSEVRSFVLEGDTYGAAECCTESVLFAGVPDVEVDLTQVW